MSTFFVWALLFRVHILNSSSLRCNLPRQQYTCCTVLTTSWRPHWSPLVSSPQLSHNDSLGAKGITKNHWEEGLVYCLPYSSHTSHHPSQTPCLPWISYVTQKLMLDSCKMPPKQSEAFHIFLWHFFPNLKHNFIAYSSSQVPDCIFEIHLLWKSGFSKVYSSCFCRCSFEPEIIKIGQSSDKMYNINILNYQESMTILNAHTKK